MFLQFHIHLYFRNRFLEAKNNNGAMKMTKNHIIPETEIHCTVNWMLFAYGCITFENTKLWHHFLTISSVQNFRESINEEK